MLPSTTRWRVADCAAFAAVCVFALLLRAPVTDIPLERDEGEYAYVAQRWLRGELPYRDSFNQKPPGVHVLYVAMQSLGATSPAAIHWSTQGYTLGTLAVLFVLGRRLSTTAGGFAAAAVAAFMTTDPSVLGNAANTEIFRILPLAAAMLAALAFRERPTLGWAAAAGTCVGVAVLFKQVALSNGAFHVLFIAWASRRRGAATVAFLIGALAVVGPVCLYFLLHGAWADFFDATVGHNLAYAARLPLALYPEAFWTNFRPCLRVFWPTLLLALVQVLRLGWPLGAPPRTWQATRRSTLLVVIWLAASFVGTAGGGFFRQHYFIQSIPAVAVLAGMAIGLTRLPPMAARLSALVRLAAVAVPIAFGIATHAWYYLPGDVATKARRIYGGNLVADAPAVGRFIADRSAPDDTVFIFGSEPQILYYAQRRSASRYVFIYPLTGPFPDVRERQHAAWREISANRPRFIVVVTEPYSFLADPHAPGDLPDALAALVKDAYRLVAILPIGADGPADGLLTGEAAQVAAERDPYGCCALLLWERDRNGAS